MRRISLVLAAIFVLSVMIATAAPAMANDHWRGGSNWGDSNWGDNGWDHDNDWDKKRHDNDWWDKDRDRDHHKKRDRDRSDCDWYWSWWWGWQYWCWSPWWGWYIPGWW